MIESIHESETPTAVSETPATDSPESAPAKPTWEDLGLSEPTLELIRKAGFSHPTPIQSESIPLADRKSVV